MGKSEFTFSVRADLFRVAQAFTETRDPRFNSVRIEPLSEGGVALIGWDGADMIVIGHPEGQASRAGNVRVGKAITNIAVDIFRRHGEFCRLVGADNVAFIRPDTGGQAARDYESDLPFPDWRAVLQPHAFIRMDQQFAFSARAMKKLSDAAIGLARAGGAEEEVFEIRGGQDATIATFPAWPGAAALFTHTQDVVHARRHYGSTLWHPPAWLSAPGVSAVAAL